MSLSPDDPQIILRKAVEQSARAFAADPIAAELKMRQIRQANYNHVVRQMQIQAELEAKYDHLRY